MPVRLPLRRCARLKAWLPARFSVLLAALLLASVPATAAAQGQGAQPLRRIGVWLTNSPSPLYYDPARIDRAVAELAAAAPPSTAAAGRRWSRRWRRPIPTSIRSAG